MPATRRPRRGGCTVASAGPTRAAARGAGERDVHARRLGAPTWDAQAGDRITVDTSGGGLKVHAAPGSHGQPLSLIFYTPPTQTGVRPGVYPHPRWIRDLERGPGDAAMEVVLDGHNPEELSGRFEVRSSSRSAAS